MALWSKVNSAVFHDQVWLVGDENKRHTLPYQDKFRTGDAYGERRHAPKERAAQSFTIK